jgi:hypothetical protein
MKQRVGKSLGDSVFMFVPRFSERKSRSGYYVLLMMV